VDHRLRAGMTVTVSIDTEHERDTLATVRTLLSRTLAD